MFTSQSNKIFRTANFVSLPKHISEDVSESLEADSSLDDDEGKRIDLLCGNDSSMEESETPYVVDGVSVCIKEEIDQIEEVYEVALQREPPSLYDYQDESSPLIKFEEVLKIDSPYYFENLDGQNPGFLEEGAFHLQPEENALLVEPYECDTCKEVFSSKYHITRHRKICTGGRPYECKKCEKHFSKKSHLVDHMRIHSGQKPFTCVVCKKSFSRSSNLTSHMIIHSGKKPYRCEICNKDFTNCSNLNRHRKLHIKKHVNSSSMEESETPYMPDGVSVCIKEEIDQVCEVALQRKPPSLYEYQDESSPLIKFEEVPKIDSSYYFENLDSQNPGFLEEGASQLQPEESALVFSSKYHSTRHKKICTGGRPYECKKCKKHFSKKSHLVDHMRIHTGQKPFTCVMCKKSFSRSSNLTSHMIIHSGKKPYRCEICNKDFTNCSNLIRHRKLHIKKHGKLVKTGTL